LRRFFVLLPALLCFAIVSASAQISTGSAMLAQLGLKPESGQSAGASALNDPSVSPGTSFLYGLEAKFAKATAEGGGHAFASFFAEDAVTLANGKAPVIGKAAIAQQATWNPKQYQLTWKPDGARMSSAGDMGFTWGHYDGRSIDQHGQSVVTGGRYFTVWKKQKDGAWKVELDASNNEPANSGDCCRLP
jgi:ketosteroid isomerase-like protein